MRSRFLNLGGIAATRAVLAQTIPFELHATPAGLRAIEQRTPATTVVPPLAAMLGAPEGGFL